MVLGHHSWPGFCHLPLLGEVSLRVNLKFNSWVDPKAHWIKALIWDIIVFWYFWCSLWCSALVVFVLLLVFFAVRSGVYFSSACPLTFPCFSICGGSDALFFVLCSLPFRAFRRGISVGSILRVCQVFLWCYFLCSFIVLFFPWCFLVFCCAPSHIQDKQACYFAFWSLRVSSEVRIYTTDQTKHPGVWSLSRWKQKGIKRYDKHHHKDTLHWPISIITIYIYI